MSKKYSYSYIFCNSFTYGRFIYVNDIHINVYIEGYKYTILLKALNYNVILSNALFELSEYKKKFIWMFSL